MGQFAGADLFACQYRLMILKNFANSLRQILCRFYADMNIVLWGGPRASRCWQRSFNVFLITVKDRVDLPRYQGRLPTEPYVRISRIRLFKIGVYFTVWHTALMTHKVFSWRVESVELPPPIFSSRPNLLFPSDFFVTGNVSSILKPLDKSFATFRYFRPYRSNCSVTWVRQWLHFRLRGWCLFISTIRPVHSDSISSGSRLPVLPRWFLHLHLLNFKVVLISEHKLTSRFLGAL